MWFEEAIARDEAEWREAEADEMVSVNAAIERVAAVILVEEKGVAWEEDVTGEVEVEGLAAGEEE